MANPFGVTVEVTGLERAQAVARQMKHLGEDPRPLLQIAGQLLTSSTLRRFETGRGPGGVPWPITKRQVKRAVGKSGPVKARILVDTGDLQDSLRYEVRPGEVEIGFDGLKNPVKAPANQFGVDKRTVVVRHTRIVNSAFGVPLPSPKTVTVRGHARYMRIPARPMLGVDAQDREDLVDAWRDYLEDLFSG